jgi:hypothetical protein
MVAAALKKTGAAPMRERRVRLEQLMHDFRRIKVA